MGRLFMFCASWGLLLSLVTLGCQENPTPTPSISSETHWMALCDNNESCGDGAQCICGVCTVACDDDLQCGDTQGLSACVPANTGVAATLCDGGAGSPRAGICLAPCDADDACGDVLRGLRCEETHCSPGPDTPSGCVTDDECAADQFCGAAPGVCGQGAGLCADVPENCTADFEPVCGCDGQTYSNECAAAAVGVNVAAGGECEGGDPPAERECGARLGDTCEGDEYCHFELRGRCGAADLPGVCRLRPDVCNRDFAPVCGCDGQTYSNECSAHGAGTSVASEGECDGGLSQPCANDDDCERAQFCRRDAGVCGDEPNTLGVCANTDEDCPAIFAPVCGCDGQTYGNECTAYSAGVNVASEGECEGDDPPAERECGARLGDTCEREEFCSFDLGDRCGATDLPGVCRPRPDTCTEEFAPVCGCDGETYSNECIANASGTSAAASGECDAEPGEDCATNDDCGRAQFCRTDVGVCAENINTPGVCADRPENCTEEFAPVCGCDGQTYSNECLAYAAGTAVLALEECE